MNGKKPTPAGIVIIAAGAVALIASFLAFYKYSSGGIGLSSSQLNAYRAAGIPIPSGAGGGSRSFSAWSNSGFLLFPLATLPALLGLVMALQVGLTTFTDVKLPARILGFDWLQIHLVCGAQALLLMLAYVLVNKGGATYGIGYWLMFIASIGLAVGAVMLSREPAPATGTNPAI
jgi:hypothetical protein